MEYEVSVKTLKNLPSRQSFFEPPTHYYAVTKKIFSPLAINGKRRVNSKKQVILLPYGKSDIPRCARSDIEAFSFSDMIFAFTHAAAHITRGANITA